jgi:transcriptional regulator GlxA family with amidase domain
VEGCQKGTLGKEIGGARQCFVVHGDVVTSGGISAGIDMSLYIVEQLLGADVIAKVKKEMEWGWFQS